MIVIELIHKKTADEGSTAVSKDF